MEQPLGEDMAALAVAAKLDFIHSEEIDRPVERHRFDGADEIGRIGRDDLFLARNECDRSRPLRCYDPVIILARQQSQRETNHPGAVSKHAFDSEMGLAGIRRPKNGEHASTGPSTHDRHNRAFLRQRQADWSLLTEMEGPVESYCSKL
jgi:hypothetical protein